VNTTTKPSFGQPALIGGVVMGVLSALPIVSAANLFCCCLWVLSGGALAAYLLQQNQPAPITPGDGALVGLLAGLIGAAVHFVLSIPIGLFIAPLERQLVQRIIEVIGPMPPDMRDFFERYAGGAEPSFATFLTFRVIALMFNLVVGAIFSTIGGLLGAAIFRRPGGGPPPPSGAPPPAPPAAAPPPPGVIDIPPTS
jgi:hypothetical protein